MRSISSPFALARAEAPRSRGAVRDCRNRTAVEPARMMQTTQTRSRSPALRWVGYGAPADDDRIDRARHASRRFPTRGEDPPGQHGPDLAGLSSRPTVPEGDEDPLLARQRRSGRPRRLRSRAADPAEAVGPARSAIRRLGRGAPAPLPGHGE